MLTASTLNRVKLFDSDNKKNLLRNILFEAIKKFQFLLYAWVILDNHYHILFQIKKGKDLSNFIKKIHGQSAIELNNLTTSRGRRVWYQYWDTCIRDDGDYWRRFNYIHHNPIKHRYTNEMENYKFSSYQAYLKKYGKDWLDDCFQRYPIIDFTFKKDNNF
ncbi:MAG: transposase [Patescibacteria group bacterium]